MTQQVAARRHAAAELIPDFLTLRFLSTILAVIALVVTASFEHRPEVRSLLHWYGIGSLFVGLGGADFLLTSLELFHARSLLSLIQQALYAAGVLLLVRSPKDIMWVPASILGSVIILNLATWVVLWWKGFRVPFVIAPGRWWAFLVPSFHYAVSALMGTMYHRSGHLVVRWFLGDYALGLYAAAVRFVDLLRNFVNTGLNVLMPRMAISAQSEAGLKRLVSASVSVLAAFSIPLSLGTLATAHLVVPWVMGANYVAAVGPVRWMAGYMVAAPIASLLSGTVLYAMGNYRSYMASSALGALVAVLASLMLVRPFGLVGVCTAFVLAELAVGATAYLLIPPSLRDLWKNPFITVAAFSGLLMVGAVRVMNSYSSRPVLIVAAGALVYLSTAAFLGRKILTAQFGEAR
jgi:O-antigen/teichoic acid export membrane protein